MMTDEKQQQKVYRLLNELSRKYPVENTQFSHLILYVDEYERQVHQRFSATVFYQGMHDACAKYKRIVQFEYRNFCKISIRKISDSAVKKALLNRLRKRRDHLLRLAPTRKKMARGFEIFYGLTGGFRKKYKGDRRAIEQLYKEMTYVTERPFPVIHRMKDQLSFGFYRLRTAIFNNQHSL